MGTDRVMKCSIYQHGELYNCDVCLDFGEANDIRMIAVRADKVKVNYNTKNKMFTVAFFYGAMRVAEASVNKVYIYDLEENNKIQLPSYDAEWPYDDVWIEMKEE